MSVKEKNNLLTKLSNDDLIKSFQGILRHEREHLVFILEHISIMEQRKAVLPLGYSSVFAYMVKSCGLSEHETYLRIQAARVMEKYPEMIPFIKSGEINLSMIKLLSPHLTSQNKISLFSLCKGKSVRELESHLKRLKSPPAPPSQKLKPSERKPETTTEPYFHSGAGLFDQGQTLELKKQKIKKFQVEMDEDTDDLLGKIRSLMSHKFPKGMSEAEILRELMQFYIAKKSLMVEKKKTEKKSIPVTVTVALPEKPNVDPRKIPLKTKREVWRRAKGCCQFTGPDGTYCRSTWQLEIDHTRPVALGGSGDLSNLRLVCRNHNLFLARKKLGKTMDPYLKSSYGVESVHVT